MICTVSEHEMDFIRCSFGLFCNAILTFGRQARIYVTNMPVSDPSSFVFFLAYTCYDVLRNASVCMIYEPSVWVRTVVDTAYVLLQNIHMINVWYLLE